MEPIWGYWAPLYVLKINNRTGRQGPTDCWIISNTCRTSARILENKNVKYSSTQHGDFLPIFKTSVCMCVCVGEYVRTSVPFNQVGKQLRYHFNGRFLVKPSIKQRKQLAYCVPIMSVHQPIEMWLVRQYSIYSITVRSSHSLLLVLSSSHNDLACSSGFLYLHYF